MSISEAELQKIEKDIKAVLPENSARHYISGLISEVRRQTARIAEVEFYCRFSRNENQRSIAHATRMETERDEATSRIAELEAERDALAGYIGKAEDSIFAALAPSGWGKSTHKHHASRVTNLCNLYLGSIATIMQFDEKCNRLIEVNIALRKALEPFAIAASRNTGVNQLPKACPLVADPTAKYSTLTIGDLHRALKTFIVHDLSQSPPRPTQPNEQRSSPARNSD